MIEEEFPSINCALEFNYLFLNSNIKLCNINMKLFFPMAFITTINRADAVTISVPQVLHATCLQSLIQLSITMYVLPAV
jgi:hypothetical protein